MLGWGRQILEKLSQTMRITAVTDLLNDADKTIFLFNNVDSFICRNFFLSIMLLLCHFTVKSLLVLNI